MDLIASILPAGVPDQVYFVGAPCEIIEDRLTLKWRAPKDNGAMITHYTFYQRKVNEDGSRSDWEGKVYFSTYVSGRNVLQHEVVGLQSGKMYEFQVTATNGCGESPKGEDATIGVKVLGKVLKRGFKLQLNEINKAK